MIIVLKENVSSEERAKIAQALMKAGVEEPLNVVQTESGPAICVNGKQIIHETREAISSLPGVDHIVAVHTPYMLASKSFKREKTVIRVGSSTRSNEVIVGNGQPVMIAGPCAVESPQQLISIAIECKKAGAQILRGGAFKPRTSPYAFQGLGIDGLKMLAEAREETGMPIITEVMEPGMVEVVARYSDILQIGSRNMQNFPLLQAAGKAHKPVLLKRGLSSTIEEWLLAAEYILAGGNPNVILCERGIRSFDPQTRNVLDLGCIPLLSSLTHLPIIVDPSHATGKRDLVMPMSCAAVAAGADGLMVDVHNQPEMALCDGAQAIQSEELGRIVESARTITQSLYGIQELSA